MDEHIRLVERAALAGDPMAAQELERLLARREGWSIEDRVKELVKARFTLVLDYHKDWTASVTEIQAFGLKTWMRLQSLKRGDKAKMKVLAEEILAEVAPEQAASRARHKARRDEHRPLREWSNAIRTAMYGTPRRGVRQDDGSYTYADSLPHVVDVAEVRRLIDACPAEEADAVHYKRQWLGTLERETRENG